MFYQGCCFSCLYRAQSIFMVSLTIAVITNENICKCQINVAKTNYQNFLQALRFEFKFPADPRRQNPAFSSLGWQFFFFFFLFFASIIFMLLGQKIVFLKIFLHNTHFNLMLLPTNLNPVNFLFASLCTAQ